MASAEHPDPFTAATLAEVYAEISAEGGVTVATLRERVTAFSTLPIADADIQAFREGKKPWKKLRDEVVPVEHFLSAEYPDSARVRFPLDDQPPDAWLTPEPGAEPIGIEVTGALARSGIETAKNMAGGKAVPGFIALPDDATKETFAKVRDRGRVMNARTSVDRVIDDSITNRMAGKDHVKFSGHILLITAPIGSSPNRQTEALVEAHAAAAADLPFAEVFVLDRARGSPIVRLK
ncbi:hypothetical protein [Sphingobium sp. CECT 9361]|uniref:hypothetical protein n=1 Tax=Sphingobium sp. CECT 9361 TaxID=2845384 RepID=UPI001E3916D8|nr:hypothetical protein [Sphingobium sp. CECT 9361]CAH0354394.1 hypothetical protein SPH9361_03002 [Sphingobium sp. CECT 9361]